MITLDRSEQVRDPTGRAFNFKISIVLDDPFDLIPDTTYLSKAVNEMIVTFKENFQYGEDRK